MPNLKGYARLLRLPLFVTAAADSVAGYAAASLAAHQALGLGPPLLLAGASSGLYLFGMVENDLSDIDRDRRLGVGRPLVTGEATIRGALVLLMGAILLTALCAIRLPGPAAAMVIVTFITINLYNLAVKEGPSSVAMTVMGLCRLFNFGIGVLAAVGIPSGRIDMGLFLPSGPLWMRHGLMLFFVAALASGYSVAARSNVTVSTRPWQVVLVVALIGGLALWMATPLVNALLATVPQTAGHPATRFVPPLARVFALAILALLWPGRLWSAAGPKRKASEYAPFIDRALYWLILADAAFVLDAMTLR